MPEGVAMLVLKSLTGAFIGTLLGWVVIDLIDRKRPPPTSGTSPEVKDLKTKGKKTMTRPTIATLQDRIAVLEEALRRKGVTNPEGIQNQATLDVLVPTGGGAPPTNAPTGPMNPPAPPVNIAIPSFLGLTINQARNVGDQWGLTIDPQGWTVSDNYDRNTVANQDPHVGSPGKVGDTVRVMLSLGAQNAATSNPVPWYRRKPGQN